MKFLFNTFTPPLICGIWQVIVLCCGLLLGSSVWGQQVALSIGYHAAVLCQDGTVQTWGANNDGQLGYTTVGSNSATPTTVMGLNEVVAVTTGYYATYVLRCDGTVWAFGQGNYGQLGNGNNTSSIAPVQVSGINNAVALAAGSYHAAALLADGTIRTWGSNAAGQLGDGSVVGSTNVPVVVSGINNATAIVATRSGVVALLADATLKAWGQQTAQLDGGATGDSNIPISVSGVAGVNQLYAGAYDVMAVLATNTVVGWGNDVLSSPTPVTIAGLSNIVDIAIGYAPFSGFALAIDQSNNLYAWGSNAEGCFGVCSPASSTTPIVVSSVVPGTDIQAHNNFVIANANGNLQTWGNNQYGQLGIGSIGGNYCTAQTPLNTCNASPDMACICTSIPTEALACCINQTTFANAPVTIYDDRPAYVVPATATWTSTNNPFVNLYGWASGVPIALNVDIVIPANVTLQLSNIQFNFAPQCRVLVQRNAVLIADIGQAPAQTVFEGLCNTMWQGIQIEGNPNGPRSGNFGTAQLLGNVKIEDAIVGIACQRLPLMEVNLIAAQLATTAPNYYQDINKSIGAEWFYTPYFNVPTNYVGGLCQISKDAKFKNCFTGLLLNRFHYNGTAPSCGMEGASMLSTGSLKYPFTALSYSYPSEVGVLLNDYWDMCVGPCNADAAVLDGNTFNNLKIGLRAIASTDNTFFENTVLNCRIGVSASNTLIGMNPDLRIRMNQIQQAERGVQADGLQLSIRQNNLENAATLPGSFGVFLNGCDFDVRQNDISRFTMGCILNQNGTEPSQVFNNIFEQTNNGVWAVGNNGTTAAGGTQITCNQFNNHLYSALRVQNSIMPAVNATLDDQGNNVLPADNVFNSAAATDLYSLINPNFIHYY